MKSAESTKKRNPFIPPKVSLALACFLTVILTGCDSKQQEQVSVPPPSVSVYQVSELPVGEYKEFVGRTQAVDTVDLRARVEGFLTLRNFIEGETVKQGQLLFEIDRKPFMAALQKAEADLAGAQAEFTRASQDLLRSQDLFIKGHVSQADLDALTSNKLRADASVQAAEAVLDSARLNLEYTQITAPFDGQIGRANYSVGNFVGPASQPLATLNTVDPVYVTFQLNERDLIERVQRNSGQMNNVGQEFQMNLRLPDGSEYNQEGVFNFADTSIDATTGTLNLRATFPNPDRILLPGLYVTLMVESIAQVDLPVIPQSAVQENQSGRFVLVVNEQQQVDTRIIRAGRRIGPMWVVTEGLEAGEQIVVEGLQKVRPGVQVQPSVVDVDFDTGAIVTGAQG